MSFKDEIILIKELYKDNNTIMDIAKMLNKEYGWVYRRINKNYLPKTKRSYKSKNKIIYDLSVTNFLKNKNHIIKEKNKTINYMDTFINIDILSKKDNTYYMTKIIRTNQKEYLIIYIEKYIGSFINLQYYIKRTKTNKDIIYQIAISDNESCNLDLLSNSYISYIEQQHDINIIYF